MQTDIDKLLQMNVELEGMFLVLSRRDTPEVRKALQTKMDAFVGVFNSLMGNDVADAEQPSPMIDAQPASVVTEQLAPVVVEPQPEAEKIEADKLDEAENGEEETSFDFADDVLSHVGVEAQLTSLDEIRETEDESPAVGTEPAVIDGDGENCEPVRQSVTAHDEIALDPEMPEDEIAIEREEEAAHADIPVEPEEPKARDEIKVDELISRREARDLRRAFTLNDKFRFRRELFGSNDALFGQVLNRLSELEDLPEAESYLYDYLGLDRDNDDVKDFVAIVANHFAAI